MSSDNFGNLLSGCPKGQACKKRGKGIKCEPKEKRKTPVQQSICGSFLNVEPFVFTACLLKNCMTHPKNEKILKGATGDLL